MCVDYQRGGSCLSAVYRDYGKCSLKSSSIAAAIDAPNATWIIVYCGDGEAASNDGSGTAGDTGITGDTAFPPPTLGDGFTSQDNVKRDGATGVNVRWNQSIDQCIALCENEEGCAHVNYRKSSRGCFMLRDDGTLAGDSAFKLLTLCAPGVCLLCAGRRPRSSSRLACPMRVSIRVPSPVENHSLTACEHAAVADPSPLCRLQGAQRPRTRDLIRHAF